MAIVIAPLTTAVMNAVETHRSGIASGVNNAVTRAASLLAIAILGLVMVGVFDTSLDTRLTSLRVAPTTRSSIDAQRSKLVATPLPPGISLSQRAQLQRALKESFVAGFRVVMLVSAALTLCSALISAWLIEGKKAGPEQKPEARVVESTG
jgi:hypothetical protein